MSASRSKTERGRTIARWLIAAFYLVAGVAHLRSSAPFLTIMPSWVPLPREIVLITGLCEIAGAIAILVPATRRIAGIMLALYALLVFPANIKHALDYIAASGAGPGLWYHVPRLMLQPVIIWWALFAGNVVTWPLGRKADRRAT